MSEHRLTRLAQHILGPIPADWDAATIGGVAKLGSGGTPSRSKHERYFANGTTRWVKTGDLNNASIRDTEEHITDAALQETACCVYPANTLLIAMYGGFRQIGRTGLLARPAATNQALTAIQMKNGRVDPEFLQHWLNAKVHAWRPLAGSSRKDPNITKSEIELFPVPVPPGPEQAAISRILRTLGCQIDAVAGMHKAMRKLKRGLLQQVLTGQRRFPEFRKEPWVERRVGEVLQETFRPVQWNEEEEYRLASIRRGSKGLFDRGRLLGRQIKVKKLNTIRTNDFLISHIQAAYGAMGLVPKAFDGARVSDMYTVLTPKDPDTIDMRFVNYMSQRKEMRHMAYLSSNGFFAERLRLNFDPHDFLHRKVLLPPTVEEQTKIADTLQALDDEIDGLQQLHNALKEQKKGLMQKLLTGQVRVPPSMLKEAAHA